jgi:hypothetical protein
VTEPRDELRSTELLSTGRGRLTVAALVVLALAVVVIAARRADRQGVGTTPLGASPSASASASPSESPSPSAEPSPSPASPVPTPTPPRLTAATGSRLVVVQGTQLEVLDVDTGRISSLPRHPRAADYDRLDVVAVAGQLVLLGDNNTGAGSGPFPAYATTSGPGSRLRVVGQASYLIRSVHLDRVWLVADVDNNNAAEAGSTLTEVDVRGVVHKRAHFRHRFGVQPFADGFLVDASLTAPGDAGDQGTDLVDAHGRRLHHYDGHPRIVSGNTALLAANDVPCRRDCPLLVLTAGASISERTVEMDAVPGLTELGLSRDSTRLFTSVMVEGTEKPPSRVTELDLETGRAHQLTDAWAETFFGASFVFSPDGRWMFFSDADARHVNAYDLTMRRTFRVKGSFRTITQLEVLPR